MYGINNKIFFFLKKCIYSLDFVSFLVDENIYRVLLRFNKRILNLYSNYENKTICSKTLFICQSISYSTIQFSGSLLWDEKTMKFKQIVFNSKYKEIFEIFCSYNELEGKFIFLKFLFFFWIIAFNNIFEKKDIHIKYLKNDSDEEIELNMRFKYVGLFFMKSKTFGVMNTAFQTDKFLNDKCSLICNELSLISDPLACSIKFEEKYVKFEMQHNSDCLYNIIFTWNF